MYIIFQTCYPFEHFDCSLYNIQKIIILNNIVITCLAILKSFTKWSQLWKMKDIWKESVCGDDEISSAEEAENWMHENGLSLHKNIQQHWHSERMMML